MKKLTLMDKKAREIEKARVVLQDKDLDEMVLAHTPAFDERAGVFFKMYAAVRTCEEQKEQAKLAFEQWATELGPRFTAARSVVGVYVKGVNRGPALSQLLTPQDIFLKSKALVAKIEKHKDQAWAHGMGKFVQACAATEAKSDEYRSLAVQSQRLKAQLAEAVKAINEVLTSLRTVVRAVCGPESKHYQALRVHYPSTSSKQQTSKKTSKTGAAVKEPS